MYVHRINEVQTSNIIIRERRESWWIDRALLYETLYSGKKKKEEEEEEESLPETAPKNTPRIH